MQLELSVMYMMLKYQLSPMTLTLDAVFLSCIDKEALEKLQNELQ